MLTGMDTTYLEVTQSSHRSPASNTPNVILNKAEVAALFQLRPRTIDRLAASGKITSFRVHGSRRFHRDDLFGCLHAGRASKGVRHAR